MIERTGGAGGAGGIALVVFARLASISLPMRALGRLDVFRGRSTIPLLACGGLRGGTAVAPALSIPPGDKCGNDLRRGGVLDPGAGTDDRFAGHASCTEPRGRCGQVIHARLANPGLRGIARINQQEFQKRGQLDLTPVLGFTYPSWPYCRSPSRPSLPGCASQPAMSWPSAWTVRPSTEQLPLKPPNAPPIELRRPTKLPICVPS